MVLSFLFGLAVLPAMAQAELQLHVGKVVGFQSGNKLQGSIAMRASGPTDLVKVTFYLDGQVVGEDTEAPFSVQLNTGSYTTGAHEVYAAGQTASGQTLQSPKSTIEFVTSEEAMKFTGRIVVPLLVVILIAALLSAIFPMLGGRKLKTLPPGAERNYGAAGGAICRNCGRPFSRNFFSPNLLFGKLERCPFCGKWAILPAASPQDLRLAEQRELEDARATGLVQEETEEEKLRKELEKSRYQDS
jgi:hypothetical protein